MLIGAVAVRSILFPRSIGGSGGDLDFGAMAEATAAAIDRSARVEEPPGA
jgi:hypothetical protein